MQKSKIVQDLELAGFTEGLENSKEEKTYDLSTTDEELQELLVEKSFSPFEEAEAPAEEVKKETKAKKKKEEEVVVEVLTSGIKKVKLLGTIKRQGQILYTGTELTVPEEEAQNLIEMKIAE